MPSASIPALTTIAMDAGASAATVNAAAAVSAALPSFATVASIGSSAISALGTIAQSRASAASAGYNAKVAAQNADIAKTNAGFAGGQGERDVGAAGAKTKATIAATLANEAGSGIDVNTGSAVDVRQSEAKLGMLNALDVRSQAAQKAYGFQTESASDIGQSQLLRKQQSSDTTGGYLNAGATVLGGVGKAAQYTNWLQNGGL